jgi:lipoprotein-anchoring transpeptidase ErfK/SrfK
MYKVPLIILLTLVLIGLCYIGWRSWKPPKTANNKTATAKKVTKPAKKDGAKKPPELAKTDPAKTAKTPENKPLDPPSMTEKPVVDPANAKPPQPQPKEIKPVEDKPVQPVIPPQPEVKPEPPTAAEPPAAAPSSDEPPEFAQLMTQAEAQHKNGMLVAARELVYRALTQKGVVEYSKAWYRATDLLNKVNGTLMNTAAPAPEKKRYVIKHGDSLSRIARTQKTTVQALQRMNELSKTSAVIHPGNSLYYIEGLWSIKVSKSQYTLSLYLNEKLYRVYKVGVGRQDRTPVGVFEILNKSREPSWAPPGREPLPYGHPDNIIGTRWMGLKPIEGTDPYIRGYGIHGTVDPDSVGTPSSAGCVRLRNEQVEELFDFIPEPTAEKTRVVIIE